MKPIKLIMQAFGSYGARTEIDFTTPRQNIFLITGDTGAGKTTIFDAMCFALYGEASSGGNKKDGMELQSQFIDNSREPYVELTFREGDEIYTVRRSPRHMRPKERGSGSIAVSESVSLTMPDGTEYPQKETNEKLIEIIGLSKEQFMQVAMIAQGEFMDMLRAKSDEKKAIFRKLFGTGLYQGLQEEAKRRMDEKESEVTGLIMQCRTLVGQIKTPADPMWARLNTLVSDIANARDKGRSVLKGFSVTDMEALMAQLRILVGQLEAEKEALTAQEKRAEEIRNEASTRYTKAETLVNAFTQLDDAVKRIRQNELDALAMEEKRRLIQQILDAYEVYAAWKLWDAAQKRLTETSQALSAQQAALPELTKAQTAAQGEKAAADTRAEEMLKAYSLVEERVSKALTLFDDITKAEDEQRTADSDQKTAKAAEAKAQQALTDLEGAEKGWRKTEAELQGVPLKVQQCNQKKTEANGIHADISEIKKQSAEIIRQEADANQAANQFVRAKNAYEEKNQEYQQKQEAFLNAQAGFLAREKLQPGKPCPVCGSTVHPQPCTLSEEHRELNRELIEKLKTETDRLQAQMSEASRVSGEMAVHLNGLRAKRQEAMDKLRERMAQSIENLPAEWNLDTAREALSGWVKKIAAESETLTKQNDRLAAVQKQLAGVEQQRENIRTDADKKRSAAEKAVQAVTAAQTRLAELLKNKQYETPESARAELQKAAAERDAASAEQKEKMNKANSAADALTKATTLIGEYESKLPALRQESTNSETAYQSLLFTKQLNEGNWKKTVTDHRKDEAEQLTRELQAFEQEKSGAQQQKETAEKLIDGQERPDLAALSQQKQEAQESYTAVADKLNQLTPLLKLDSEVLQKLEKQMQERMQALHAFEQLRSIYTRLSGNVTGAKMDIETFAQRYYLKRILHHANRRFTTMTAGQFEMRLCDMEQAGKGTNHGLDLTIYSFVTQKTRDIRTLSGGESFMAALSLALGMADQIQESSSAVHLDMMFIDEGFGSLDDHSRAQAVKVLKALAGGTRLISIISHVTELKQEIDEQLIVSKAEDGSHIRWQLN